MSSDPGSSPDPLAPGRLVTQRQDGVGWVLFDNARRLNVLTPTMLVDYRQAMEDFSADDDIRVVVVRGAGDRVFSAGADLSDKSFADRAERENPQAEPPVIDKPVISMIHGVCIGGGLAIALSADMRIVAEDARFGIPVARLGLAYPVEIMRKVVALIGPSAASLLSFTADVIDAQEALRIGLVDRVVAKASLEETVTELAHRIAIRAPLSVRASKATIRAISGDQAADLDRCIQMIASCRTSEDAIEGRTAFLEKRDARFRGR